MYFASDVNRSCRVLDMSVLNVMRTLWIHELCILDTGFVNLVPLENACHLLVLLTCLMLTDDVEVRVCMLVP